MKWQTKKDYNRAGGVLHLAYYEVEEHNNLEGGQVHGHGGRVLIAGLGRPENE